MVVARKYRISGFVQGVGFRFFVQQAAAKHQVLGYVRNLKDGTVESYAEGKVDAIKAFHEDLLTGPAYSRVDEVEETVLDPLGSFSAFLIER